MTRSRPAGSATTVTVPVEAPCAYPKSVTLIPLSSREVFALEFGISRARAANSWPRNDARLVGWIGHVLSHTTTNVRPADEAV